LHLTYISKIPSAKFTHYGFDQNGGMNLKNWFITPARFESHHFVKNNNFNLDDIANATTDYEVEIKIPNNYSITTDLNSVSKESSTSSYSTYSFLETTEPILIYLSKNKTASEVTAMVI
jgi:hypothetical protein